MSKILLLEPTRQVEMAQLRDFIKADPRMVDLRRVAYFLATVRHETANTFKPITERGALKYFDKYEPGTRLGKILGNTEKGDGYKYRGHGYCQITGRGMFTKFAKLLDKDLVNTPSLALEPAVAYEIAIQGMTKGLFTGVKFDTYFTDTKTDWVNARRIINGLDCAEKIADYARQYYEFLIS
jgi:predicted chitinase